MSDVIVVGALHLDVVVDAPRLPALDETLFGDQVAYRFGGKGGNQALAAARMGASVAMVGRVGQDAFADTVLEALRASGVDHSQVHQVSGATGMSVAIINTGGEYGAVVVSGVNQTINAEQIKLSDSKVILLQNEIPEDVNIAVAHQAKDALVVLNAAPARDTSADLLSLVDVLVVNRVEAEQLSTQTDPKIATRSLSALGPKQVIATLGADGAVVLDTGVLRHIAPPLRAKGSAHGAGDAFVGALAAELADGKRLVEAAEFASVAAAHFVGTAPDLRTTITRRAVEAWVANVAH